MIHKFLGRTGLNISRIGLGTAEIGFAYGIGSRYLPSEKEAIQFLQLAVDLGITYFDTACFYGLAEERIGKSEIGRIPDIVIATKCGQFLEAGEDPRGEELERRLREQVEMSLKNLNTECIPLLMLHGGSVAQLERGELVEIFRKFQREGKAKFFGISTRGEENTLAAIKCAFFEVILVAYSILDQRMTEKVLPLALDKKIGVVNRSVLLKGALTPLIEKLPSSLGLLKINSQKAKAVARRLGIDLPALAIRFTLSNDAISNSLIGTNNVENLKEAVKAVEAGPLKEDVVLELKNLAINDPYQVDPFLWPKN